MSNKNEEIAVEIKNKVWSWTPSTMIEKQWKIISTSYKIEYTLGAVQKFSRIFYLIKNSNGDKIAHTDRCLLELGKTDKAKIPKLNQRWESSKADQPFSYIRHGK